MTKTIVVEKYIKKFYTKNEIRYIVAQKWIFVTRGMVPAGCDFKYKFHASNANYDITEITLTTKEQAAALDKAMNKRANELRKKIDTNCFVLWCKITDKKDAQDRKLTRERNKIKKMIVADCGCTCYSLMINHLNAGSNIGEVNVEYRNFNAVRCYEKKDWNGYSRSCRFPKITRDFTLCIRRGWHVFYIGGLITFVKGSRINREGMACEWVEQGKAIADIETKKGYLVRGEHIEAKSLAAAKAISAEHRAAQLARLLAHRRKMVALVESGKAVVTYNDSIKSGNCIPGTNNFKRRYEAEIGHEVNAISIADLRKYGKKFGVSYYAERAISYVLSH